MGRVIDWRKSVFSSHECLGLACGPLGRSHGGAEATDSLAPEQSLTLGGTVTSQLVSPSPGSLSPNLKV